MEFYSLSALRLSSLSSPRYYLAQILPFLEGAPSLLPQPPSPDRSSGLVCPLLPHICALSSHPSSLPHPPSPDRSSGAGGSGARLYSSAGDPARICAARPGVCAHTEAVRGDESRDQEARGSHEVQSRGGWREGGMRGECRAWRRVERSRASHEVRRMRFLG